MIRGGLQEDRHLRRSDDGRGQSDVAVAGRQGTGRPLPEAGEMSSPPEESLHWESVCQHLAVSPRNTHLDFWPPELSKSKFVLF